MSTYYTWDYVPTSSSCCPVAFDGHRPGLRVICPRAPRPQTAPLGTPAATAETSVPSSQILLDPYPIQLSSPHNSPENSTDSIFLTFPIHIHTPTAHLALFQRGIHGQSISARDMILNIKAFIRKPVEYTVYAQLSEEMKAGLKAAFMRRHGNLSIAAAIWDTFCTGEYTGPGPIGADLLLGCTEIWGLECVSFGGYSVVHLA